jgi:DNA-binding GntR family transcriptional regulator
MPLLEPLPEVTNLSQKVFERVREAILAGQLPPGSRLVERRLAEELEVSHIPVREALARLADEGLVERNARRGSWVANLTLEDLDEISSLRVVLEQFVVVRVQERWSSEAEQRLGTLVAEMEKAAAVGDVDHVRHADRLFHETLWELAEHKTLLELAAKLRGRINSFVRAATLALSREELKIHAASHAELLEAIASGVPRRARRAMEIHITTATKRVRRTLTDERPR